eukprot:403335012
MEDPLKLLKQKRGSLQQISKNSAVRSRKNSLQAQQNSSSQTRQNKNAKDSMAQFVQSTKSGSFHAGANGNLSSQKSALRDLSSQRSNGNNATHDENHTPPRPKKLGGKKKKTLESRNQQISIHNNNKPPLLLLQTLKRPETAKANSQQMSINQVLRESLLQNQQQQQQQNQSHQHYHQLPPTNIPIATTTSTHHIPQQIVSELESVATPHKSCQTCSKINNFMHNMHQRGSTMRDYSPSNNDNQLHDEHQNHIISINNQIDDHDHEYNHNEDYHNQLQLRQYQTLTSSTDTNAFFQQKNRTYTPKRQLQLSSNEKSQTKSRSRSKSQKKQQEAVKPALKGNSRNGRIIEALVIDEDDHQSVPQNENLKLHNALLANTAKVINVKQVKKLIKDGQEILGKSCDVKKQEMMHFKSILENEIQSYFKQSLNKLMFFKKEIKNDILKLQQVFTTFLILILFQ